MADIRYNGWARIEGCTIKDLFKEYGTLSNIPVEESYIYYGTPEIQLNHPTSTTNSVVYAVKNIDDYFGYSNIHDIDDNWTAFNTNIRTWMSSNTIDTSDPDTSYYWVGKPFVVNKSCVIFYDDSSKASITNSKYTKYAIILVDQKAVPRMISISASYEGDSVPVGDQFDEDLLKVIAKYEDGNEVRIDSGYILDPSDKIIRNVGTNNTFEVIYYDAENDVNRTSFTVPGIRKLSAITGTWTGNAIPYGKTANEKYFDITAHYTDGSSSSIGHSYFTFPNGNTVNETNKGLIQVFYKGCTCDVQVTIYEVRSSRLIAFYNGPQVEVGQNYLKSYLDIKIYYSSDEGINKSYYEDVDVEDCTIDSEEVTNEGINTYNISCTGRLGEVNSSFTVVGFNPEIRPVDIDATYNGPPVYQGNIIDTERIICNIHYSNGTIKTVKNFSVSTNIIYEVGNNEITVTYKEDVVSLTTLESTTVTLTASVFVEGLEKDSTTSNNIFPTTLDNNYPKATAINNRYRGPAEGNKLNILSNNIIKNIKELYNLYSSIERQYNKIVTDIAGDNSIKITTLNNVTNINSQMNELLTSDHYTTGTYKSEDIAI